MKIIGHRGAAGLALENTLPSLELARLLGVDAIEFDIRMTKDERIVLCHDADTARVSEVSVKIDCHSLKQVQAITLNDDQSYIPTLEEAMEVVGSTPVIIEIKQAGITDQLMTIIKKYPNADITIASFQLKELRLLRENYQNLRLFGLERINPFESMQFARELKLDGVGLNFWLLNPLTYLIAKRYKLDLYVYTVNSKLLGNFIKYLYPSVGVCTDRPEWFIKHPWLKLRRLGTTKGTTDSKH